MNFRRCFRGIGLVTPVILAGMVGLTAQAQTTANCSAAGTIPNQVASTGLTETVGTLVLTCTGGSSGATLIGGLFITLNTNITNPVDNNGNPQNITISSSGGATVTTGNPTLIAANTLAIGNITYTVPSPNTFAVMIQIGGIRAAVASISNGQQAQVSATLVGSGINIPSVQVPVALGVQAVESSALNNGISCNGVTVPSTLDFPSFIAAGGFSSAVRVTEAFAGAFAPKTAGMTNGTRIVVNYSGYGSGVRLFVPDALVGNDGTTPTSGGEFGTAVGSGSYVSASGQLLLSRVSGANPNGVGGTLLTATPAGATTFASVSELTVTNGSAYAVYEVIDNNPAITESFQAPVFIANAANNCAQAPFTDLAAVVGPVSTVSVATATDPVPRYVTAKLPSDCALIGDCNGNYFPVLTISSATISFTGSSQGIAQTTSVPMTNNGGTQLNLAITVTYQSVTGWLTVTPTFGTLNVTVNPAQLQPGTYTATISLDAGVGGSVSIPVTFAVGQVGVTIQAIVSSATFQGGKVAPGSYLSLFGADLAGTNVGVTFNGLAGTVIPIPAPYNATQINVIAPPSLSGQNSANVVATVDGKVSNTVNVGLTPNVPGIFTPGILNSDSTINSASNPAARGTFVQIYMTGLANPPTGPIVVTMGSQQNIVPTYAGAPYAAGSSLAGLDQVNVTVPAGLTLTGNSTQAAVCIQQILTAALCSNSVTLYLK